MGKVRDVLGVATVVPDDDPWSRAAQGSTSSATDTDFEAGGGDDFEGVGFV
jgi:hypothetical protein